MFFLAYYSVIKFLSVFSILLIKFIEIMHSPQNNVLRKKILSKINCENALINIVAIKNIANAFLFAIVDKLPNFLKDKNIKVKKTIK